MNGTIIKIRLIAVIVSLAVGVVILGDLVNSKTGRLWRALGKRNYIRIISEPDSVWLFQTTTFLSRLTNGPMPEPFRTIEPGIKLDGPVIKRLQDILLNPDTYSKGREDSTTPPEFVLRFTKAKDDLELEFSGDFFTMLVEHNRKYHRLLNCEPLGTTSKA